jgi:hypothetical protein
MTLRNSSYWSDDRFPGLPALAAEIPADSSWAGYGEYLLKRLDRQRESAFQVLDEFILNFSSAPACDRRQFISWLMSRIDGNVNEFVLPRALWTRLVEPTLAEWIASDLTCSEPLRWMGDESHLRQALTIDPSDEIARRKLIALILIAVGVATHELPTGYLGDPDEDLRALDEAEGLVAGLPELARQRFVTDIAEERLLIKEFIAVRDMKQPSDSSP